MDGFLSNNVLKYCIAENCGDSLQNFQSFIHQLLVASEKARDWFTEVFAKHNLACYFPKFSPAKVKQLDNLCGFTL